MELIIPEIKYHVYGKEQSEEHENSATECLCFLANTKLYVEMPQSGKNVAWFLYVFPW